MGTIVLERRSEGEEIPRRGAPGRRWGIARRVPICRVSIAFIPSARSGTTMVLEVPVGPSVFEYCEKDTWLV